MRREASRRLAAAGLAFAIGIGAGCSAEKPAEVKAASETQAGAAGPSEVILAPAVQKEAGLAAEVVQFRSVPEVVRANGRITNNEERTWRVGAVTEGRIVKVFAKVGDPVGMGQILARMHSHMIHESRAEYRKAVAELARAKTSETYARRVRDRARRLYELKAASLQQVEQAEAELRNAQTSVGNAEVDVERTRQHLVEFLEIPADESEHHKDGSPQGDEDLIPIKAPAAGVVLTRNVTAGTVVAPAGDLFVISDLSSLWMMAAVTEENLPKLRVGMPVRVSVQAYPDRMFQGRIGRLGEELEAATRTVKVRVDLANPDGRLKPEMYANAEIESGSSGSAIFIPQTAPQEVEGKTVVFVQKGEDRFEVRPVRVGRTVQGLLEVAAGVRPGDRVVTQGSFLLKSQLLKSTLGEE